MSHSFATAWTVGHQAPLSMGLSHQEYWSWLLFPPLGDLPDLGMKLESAVSPELQRIKISFAAKVVILDEKQ